MKKRLVSIVAGVLAAVLLIGLVASAIPAGAVENEAISELERQIAEMEAKGDELQGKIDELEQKVSENMSQMEKAVAEKNVIDQEIALLHQQKANLNDQIATYGLLIADKQEDLDEAEKQLDELREKNKERIRAMEEDGELSYWAVLFEANSFFDLLDRMNMIEEIANSDHRRLQEIRTAADRVAAAQEVLTREKDALVEKKAELTAMETRLEERREKSDTLLAELNAMGEEFEMYMVEKEEEMEQLSSEIAAKNKELEHEKWVQASIEASIEESIQESIRESQEAEEKDDPVPPPTESSGGSDTPPQGLKWIAPCRYIRISSPFGMRLHPIHNTWMMHNGVDLAAPKGRTVSATRAGVVITAEWSDAYGFYVVIDHGDGFQSLYAHMTHYVVSVGETVSQGEKIGEVGSTGYSTGPHLHFEIHYNGTPVNPCEYAPLT